MKKILFLLAVLLPITAQAWDLSIDGTVAAYHTRPDTPAGHPYNQTNPGIGGELQNDYNFDVGSLRYGAILLDYDNSINKTSVLTAGTLEYCYGEDWHGCAGGMVGAVTGYKTPALAETFIAAPIIEGGYKRVSVDLTTFPTSDRKAEVFSGWVKFKAFQF